jgi:hypothetical protein
MPLRKIVSTSSWKGFAWGTSPKSASHAAPRVPAGTWSFGIGRVPGFVTVTSFSVPAGRAGVFPVMWLEST